MNLRGQEWMQGTSKAATAMVQAIDEQEWDVTMARSALILDLF